MNSGWIAKAPRRRTHVALTATGLLAILAGGVLAAGCGTGSPASDVFADAGKLQIAERIGQGPISTPDVPVDLFYPTDLLVLGDSIYIVDNGNDRVVVLDRELRYLGTIGREGGGPGEFRAPTAIRPTPAGVVVVDMGNARFTEFDRSGAVVRTSEAPSGLLQFAASETGALYVKSASRTHHFARIQGDEIRELGAWPHAPAGEGAPMLPEEQTIAVTAGDTVHVFDERDAQLYKYTPEGRLVLRRRLPPMLYDSIVATSEKLISALRKAGHRVVDSWTSKDFARTSDGELLLIVPAGETVGLVIDPRTYAARRLLAPVERGAPRPFTVRSVALEDSVFYMLRDESIFAYRVRPAT